MELNLATHPELLATLDRRSEPRMFANREVLVTWKARGVRFGIATVLDWSRIGVRIEHDLTIERDDVVEIITPEHKLSARVIWVADFGHRRETGLLITARGPMDLSSMFGPVRKI